MVRRDYSTSARLGQARTCAPAHMGLSTGARLHAEGWSLPYALRAEQTRLVALGRSRSEINAHLLNLQRGFMRSALGAPMKEE
jgi:hypothetical protein